MGGYGLATQKLAKSSLQGSRHEWSHVRFEHGEVDFTHEREWRVPGDFHLNGFGFYVIVGELACENRIQQEVSQEGLHGVLGFIHLNTLVDFL